MGKQENKITFLMILFFVLFIIFYIVIFFLLPLIYLFITIVVVTLILIVGSYVLYKKKNQILPYVIVNFFRDFIKISGKSLVKVKVPPPLTEYEKKGIIYELARGKCEHLDCNIQDNLQLYYIIPKSEGGENSYNNLVVLCPTHHAMAGRGVLSKGLLRYFIKERDI